LDRPTADLSGAHPGGQPPAIAFVSTSVVALQVPAIVRQKGEIRPSAQDALH
jgi:hypothetical protein